MSGRQGEIRTTYLCELHVMVVELLLHNLLQYSEHKYLRLLQCHLLRVSSQNICSVVE